MAVVVAGIASSRVPEKICLMMEKIGKIIAEEGWWLRTAHGAGDWFFEKGAGERSIIYLPHEDWGREREYFSNLFVKINGLQNTDRSLWEETRHEVSKYHNSYKGLDPLSKAMLSRIYLLVLGQGDKKRDREPIPVNALICWHKKPEKKKEDGDDTEDSSSEKNEAEEEDQTDDYIEETVVAMKVAEDFDIPVINLAEKYYSKMGAYETVEKIKHFVMARDKEPDNIEIEIDDDEIAEEARRLTEHYASLMEIFSNED